MNKWENEKWKIKTWDMKNENGNLLTTYVVECFDEENALCQIKTNVSVTCLCLCFYFHFFAISFCNNGESFYFLSRNFLFNATTNIKQTPTAQR